MIQSDEDWFLLRASIIVCGGGFVFGYDIGIISTTILDMNDSIPMDSWQEGMVVAIIGLGCIFGALIGGPMCDFYGRWKTIQFQNFSFIVGSVVTAASNDIGMLYLGRFIVGIASAISAVADIPYMAEISPVSQRGQRICMYEIMVSVGVLVSFFVGWAQGTSSESWRGAYMIPACITLVLSLLMSLLPESPKWLSMRGKTDELRGALMKIYGQPKFQELWECMELSFKNGHLPAAGEHFYENLQGKHERVPEELVCLFQTTCKEVEIVESGVVQIEEQRVKHKQELDFVNSIRTDFSLLREYSYLICLVFVLQAFTQLSGGVVVRNYATTIFVKSGASVKQALGFTVVLGVIKLLATVVTVNFIDKVGRRKLLMWGAALVGLGMLILCIALGVSNGTNVNVGILIGTGIAVGAYGVGYGPIPWALSSEMFPVSIRGKVIATSLISQNLSMLLTNLLYLQMIEKITPEGTFAFYFAFNMLCLLLVYLFLPETSKRSPTMILAMSRKYCREPWIKCNRYLQVEGEQGDHELLDTDSQKSENDSVDIIEMNTKNNLSDGIETLEVRSVVGNPVWSSDFMDI